MCLSLSLKLQNIVKIVAILPWPKCVNKTDGDLVPQPIYDMRHSA